VVQVTRSVIFGPRSPVEAQAASLKRADGNEGQINTAVPYPIFDFADIVKPSLCLVSPIAPTSKSGGP
jgi:hypothetical protein